MTGVTLNLTKGDRLDLTKNVPGQTKYTVGLGWDINPAATSAYDLDAFAFHLKSDKLFSTPVDGKETGIAFFGNKKIAGVELDKDNLTGEGEGDDEKLFLNLAEVPADVDAVVIGVNIYEAAPRNQKFGMVNNAYMRIYNPDTNEVYMKYDLTEDFSTATGVLLAKIYRKDGEWKVFGMGEGKSGSVQDFANSFM